METESKLRLADVFLSITDPRQAGKVEHDLVELLVVAVNAVLVGADTFVEIELWAKEKLDWLRGYLKLENGIPSHDTFGRLFGVISPDEFEAAFRRWVGAILPTMGADAVVAIDGKTSRRSSNKVDATPLHLVSAFAAGVGLVLGQRATAEKSNEKTAIPELLAMLALEGCIVTIDAMGTQANIAQAIRDRGADYVLAVKDNQKNLSQAVVEFFDTAEAFDYHNVVVQKSVSVEKNHGRIETRRAALVSDVSWMDKPMREHWQKLAAVGMIEFVQEMKDKVSVERRYFIMSAGVKTVAQFARAARAH